MAPKSKRNVSKIDPKTEAGNHPKIDLKWKPNGGQMEPKRHQQINDFLAQFSDPSGNIIKDYLETMIAASVTLSPADPPGRRHIIKDYCTIISKEGLPQGI